MSNVIMYTDGGSRGNPGPSAIGVVICNENNEIVKKYADAIGRATNNEAEYEAVIFALNKLKLLHGKTKAKQLSVEIRVDSELVAKQLTHQYKLKEEHIQKLFIQVWNLMLDFKQVNFKHIRREENTAADKLVNEALDEKSSATALPGL